MKWIWRTLVFCWLLVGASALWAGDCSGPDDCSAPPDNSSKAVVVVSIFAGAGLAFRSLNGSSEEEEPAEPDGGPAQSASGTESPDPAPASAKPPILNEPLGDPSDLSGDKSAGDKSGGE